MQRITKRDAFKRFTTGKPFYMCPCKLHPFPPFSPASLILNGQEWMERAERYRDHPELWKGTIEQTAWDLLYNAWAFSNANYECGYYAHYYIETI
jgi:hypothetical protein